MPRPQKSQKPTTSKNNQCSQLSQTPLETPFNNSQKVIENLDELVNNCVRFFIYRAGNKMPIRKIDIQKYVLKNVGKNFNSIIERVTSVLKDVYSYDLYVCNDGPNTKQYLISNSLPYDDNLQIEKQSDNGSGEGNRCSSDVDKILIMLVLAHVFMSNNYASEVSLFAFLRSLQIDPERTHKMFGDVKDFVCVTMVKQKYLDTDVEEITRRVSYVWGPRAEHEISKQKLLNFVCKMYKDRAPKSWTNQFESANAQFQQNAINHNNHNEDMLEVDSD